MKALLIKDFLRSRGLMVGLVLLLLAGLTSLYTGRQFLDKNRQILEQTAHYQQESIDRYVHFNKDNIGLLLYYVRFGLAQADSPLAGLSIGQRDVNPSVSSVTIRNLEEQKYTARLMNPMYQLLGNMDFSFVLFYFFPLIIIAFCFNLLSREQEEGTWKLVLSQTAEPMRVLRSKMAIRYISVLAVLSVLLTTAKWYLAIPFNLAFLIYGLVSFLYISFWFCLAWLVISRQWGSSQNALSLLISWVLLTIVLPAALHALITQQYPVPEAYATVLESRDGFHTQWDNPPEPTVARFHQAYPQFSEYVHPAGRDFSWVWYFAMQHMGDLEAAENVRQLKEKLRSRIRLARLIGAFIPTVHTQLSLNALSRSDLEQQLAYLEALEAFHEEKRLYFYPRVFTAASVMDEDWTAYTLETFDSPERIQPLFTLLPLVLACVLCLVPARINWRKSGLNTNKKW